jgi:hypothetical protein
MRYFSYSYFSETGNGIDTLSEDDIIREYYPVWSSKMIDKYGEEEFNKNYSRQDCIDVWIMIHSAWQVTE